MLLKYSFGQFPSKIIKTRRVADFVCTETSYVSNQIIRSHYHDYASLVITLRGGFTENYGMKKFSCTTSNLLFRPPGEIHTDLFHKPGGRCLTVEIPPHRFKKISEEYPVNLSQPVKLDDYFINTITPRLYREFCEADSLSALAIEGMILELIVELSRAYSKKSGSPGGGRRIEQAREIIHEQFTENLSIKEIAGKAGIHPVYFARAFRQKYHLTIGEYIRKLRIEKSCLEILNSGKPMSEIALECGFTDQSHFSRTFKQMIGQTPTEFRKNLSEG